MNQYNLRSCIIYTHNENSVEELCIHPKCDFQTRWLCKICKSELKHLHGEANINHIINKSQALALIKENIQALRSQNLEESNQRCKQLISLLTSLIQYAQDSLPLLENLNSQNIIKQIDYLNNIAISIGQRDQFQLLKDEDIKQTFVNKIDIKEKGEERINKIINDLDDYIKKITEYQKLSMSQVYDLIVPLNQQNVSYAALSYDEQFFAYITDKRLTIISPFNPLQHFNDNNDAITCCQFTKCSHIIYGDKQGKIFKASLKSQNLKYQLALDCKSQITNIAGWDIKNTFISTMNKGECKLIKICLASNKFFFETKAASQINILDYSNNLDIVVSICEKEIYLRNGKTGDIDFQYSNQSQIQQLMISAQNHLLTLDKTSLIIWNMKNNSLTQQQLIVTEKPIFNFSLINNDQNIALILQNKLIVKDFNDREICQIEHKNTKIQSIIFQL